jgi:hypothetical protein
MFTEAGATGRGVTGTHEPTSARRANPTAFRSAAKPEAPAHHRLSPETHPPVQGTVMVID